MFALLVCVGVLAWAGAEEEGLEVLVSGGIVKGAVRTSYAGKQYHAFSAIPYGKPPIDRQRFMPPQPVEAWEGVLDATKDGPPCAQAALGITEGEEDCLHLYVYTPKVSGGGESGSLPVVVWLPGGAFVVGGAAALQEHLIMDRNVVLVVVQYRLGLLGFFHTPSGNSTGNMGMVDQVLALRWVQENIGAFGGDPGQVTLAGDCAGGAAAIYHMLSPMSKGLFHRVMSLSGSPLSPWAQYGGNHRFLLILANYVRCPAHDQHLTVKCFQETGVWELLHPVQMLCESRDLLVGNHRLAPTVQDPTLTPSDALFLTEHPLETLTKGPVTPVPVLMGLTRDVGTHLVDLLLYDFILYKMEDDVDFLPRLLPMLLKECNIHNSSTHKQEFQEYYFPDTTWDNLTAILPGLVQMVGDIHFRAGVQSAASLLAQHVPTWLMRYEFAGGPSLFTQRYPDPSKAPPLPPSVGHGDEMALLLPEKRYSFTPEQEKASAHLLDMLENFVHGRPPREDWPVFTTQTHASLVFTEDGGFDTQPFSAPERAEMLHHIHSYLHHSVLEEMKKASGGDSGGGDSGSDDSGGGGSQGRDEL